MTATVLPLLPKAQRGHLDALLSGLSAVPRVLALGPEWLGAAQLEVMALYDHVEALPAWIRGECRERVDELQVRVSQGFHERHQGVA